MRPWAQAGGGGDQGDISPDVTGPVSKISQSNNFLQELTCIVWGINYFNDSVKF